jgi:predicted RNase H-like HicB family nuclease
MEYTYTIVLLPEPTGEFMVEVPALPGCFSRGKTIFDAVRNAEEAVRVHLTAMRKHGAEIPREGRTIPVETEDLAEGHLFRVSVQLLEAKAA